RIRSADRARSGRGDAACFGTGYGADDAAAERDRGEKSRDPESVSVVMREFAGRGSGGGSQRAAGKKGRGGREILSRRGEQVGAGRGGETGRVEDVDRCGREPAASRMRAVHWAGSGIAGSGRGRNFSDESQFQRPHGIAGCEVLSS